MIPEILTPQFQKILKEQGYPVDDILSDVTSGTDRKPSPAKVIRGWTGLSNKAIRDGLFNRDRDVVSPRINGEILGRLAVWIDTKTDEGLPTITVKEIARATRLSPEKVVNVLAKYPLSFSVNGSSFSTVIQKPKFPDKRLTLSDSREYGLSPSRVARAARYQSRAPGGGPVQRTRIQDCNIDGVIRKRAWEERIVLFNKVVPERENFEYGVMEELEVSLQDKGGRAEKIIYSESEIMQVLGWFKSVGLAKNWVYGNNMVAFRENLLALSREETVDFLIWTHLDFRWSINPKDGIPQCEIGSNSANDVLVHFKTRIEQIAAKLAKFGGSANLIFLIPTNEAFDDRVWNYLQNQEQRDIIINECVRNVWMASENLKFPSETRFDVKRWDDYLRSNGAGKKPEEYSKEGENRLRQSPNSERISKNAIRSGRKYLTRYRITDIRDEELLQRQIMYYGVYAGEGVAFEELQARGKRLVIFNLEELRVAQMEFEGAQGNLAIVTPITVMEMIKYYQSESRQHANGIFLYV